MAARRKLQRLKQLCDRFTFRQHSMKQTRYFPLLASLASTAFVILVGIQFVRPELTDPLRVDEE
jgi:hypothetical protein